MKHVYVYERAYVYDDVTIIMEKRECADVRYRRHVLEVKNGQKRRVIRKSNGFRVFDDVMMC